MESKDVASMKTQKRTFSNQSTSRCASHRGVKFWGVLPTAESSSAVCFLPTELKDDRMENSINGRRYRHILRQLRGCTRRYGPGPPPPSPLPSSRSHPTPTQSAICCTNSCLLKHYFAVHQCYFEMKPIQATQFSILSSFNSVFLPQSQAPQCASHSEVKLHTSESKSKSLGVSGCF